MLGAGVMGATIAAHLVNAGKDVVLLDLKVDRDGKSVNLADMAVATMKKAKPSPIFTASWLTKIKTGNFSDDLDLLKDCDWIIEVVKEDLAIKHKLFQTIEDHLPEDVIFTSNTSGIPIQELAAGLPESLRPRFFGTHFFNPPRYMKLLELIPGPETDGELLRAFAHFGETELGKGVVLAKDRPNFIANRIGTLGMMTVIHVMMEDGFTVEEIDKIMGPLTGRPRSAVFRTADLVGLDTLSSVSENLYNAVPEDELRHRFKMPQAIRDMVSKGYLGDKTKQGFYKKSKDAEGKRVILTLDFETMEYREKLKPNLPTMDLYKGIENLSERMCKIAFAQDRLGSFVWKTLSETLVYAVNRIGEVADDIVNIDRAMKWGFNWEMGPFETWDALGVERVAKRLEQEGREVPALVRHMLDRGVSSFYKDESGGAQYFTGNDMKDVPKRPGVLVLSDLKKDATRVIKTSPGASLLDLGDGVACLEFHGKMNTIGSDAISMCSVAVETVERDFEGLVLGNQGAQFSAGANLMLLLMEAQEGNFEEIDLMVRHFQNSTSSIRYCRKPVVVAPFGLTLGGGCEYSLHADAVQAAAETYMGLVEVGVGLIPGGGGTKEMLLRHVGGAKKRGDADLVGPLRKVFETIGMGKVASSAEEAREMGFLRGSDGVTINGDALIQDAKNRVKGLAAQGYQAPEPPTDIPVLGEPAFATLKLGLYMMLEGGYISPYDREIGLRISKVLTGGNLTPGQTMTEQQVLDLEREAFLGLCGERKTLERIHHMLKTGKPLRN